MSNLETVQRELSLISDDVLRDFVTVVLEKAPEAFWKIPASSSGKYHPMFSLNDGGLIRHIKVAIYFGRRFCRCYCTTLQVEETVIAALLLHDIAKAMCEPHDIVCAEWLLKIQALKEEWLHSEAINQCILGVRWHMGPWATGAVEGPQFNTEIRNFPTDYSLLEQLVHLADYASAQHSLAIHFDKLYD